VGSYISRDITRDDTRHEEVCPIGEEVLKSMPTTLSTTVKHIFDRVPNSVNSKLIEDFHSYMKENATSERHQNNNLKAIIAFAQFLGPDMTFPHVTTKDQITKFLDTKTKSNSDDPDKRWITTWNDYLVRIKHFFRWLYNCKINLDQKADRSPSLTDWLTPAFVDIRKKRTKRLSPYGEHEIWSIEELKAIIKYVPHKPFR